MKKNGVIVVESLISQRTGEGRVNIYLQESGSPSYQFSVEEARNLASNIFQSAEAAETDAVLFRWANEHFGEAKMGPELVTLLRKERNRTHE